MATTEAAPAAGTRLSAAEIHSNVLRAAEEELERPVAALPCSALAAGLTIGFSFAARGYLATFVSFFRATPSSRRRAYFTEKST